MSDAIQDIQVDSIQDSTKKMRRKKKRPLLSKNVEEP